MLRSFVEKIQKGLSIFVQRRATLNYFNENHDVREGYFAVHAIKGGERKRFIVDLEYLNDPAFLVLLDQAQEEYGFRQQGALAVPCRPQELKKVLDGGKRRLGRS